MIYLELSLWSASQANMTGMTVAAPILASGTLATITAPDGRYWLAGSVIIRVVAFNEFGATTDISGTITSAGVIAEDTPGDFIAAVAAAGGKAIEGGVINVVILGAEASRIQITGEMLALDATRAITAPLTTDQFNLVSGNWTKNRKQMVVATNDDGSTRIATNNGAWNALLNTTTTVVSGHEYLIRVRYRIGSSGTKLSIGVRDTTADRSSAYTIDSMGVEGFGLFAAGAIRLVGRDDRSPDLILHLRWVPNYSGATELSIGPNSAVLGEYVDVFECGIALREKRASPAVLFANPLNTPANSNWASIDQWENYFVQNRTSNPNSDAEVGRVPQRLAASKNWRTVRTPILIVEGRRYVASASWKKGVEADRIRLMVFEANAVDAACAYLRDGSTITLDSRLTMVENAVYERFGDWRRVSFEFVGWATGTFFLGVGPYAFSSGQYIDLYRAGVAEAAGSLSWTAPINATNDFDVAWPGATDAAIVTQNYVYDNLLNFSANADGAPDLDISLLAGSFSFRSPPDAPLGGLGFYDRFRKSAGGDLEGVLSYDVKLGPTFVWGKGGKLPGLMHGLANSGGSTDPTQGWSVRYMWGPSGVPYLYIYDADRTPAADDVGFAGGILIPGRWHNLTQRIKLNTVGQSDGEIEIWMDGAQVALLSGVEIRLNDLHTIEGILFDIFFGGGDVSWAHAADETISIRNMRYWSVE